MERCRKIKRLAVSGISYLYILLFTYAATNKILDFENFEAQLGQSPMLSAFAAIISRSVLILEFFIALFLLLPGYKLVGLYAAFTLMAIFTTYIVIILNYVSFIPCSCGGILEKMDWTEHLYFNLGFIILGAIGVLAFPLKTSTR